MQQTVGDDSSRVYRHGFSVSSYIITFDNPNFMSYNEPVQRRQMHYLLVNRAYFYLVSYYTDSND